MIENKAPQWTAPATLLPRVMTAVSQPQAARKPVTAAGILVTAALCGSVGVAVAMLLGVLPAPSAASALQTFISASNLVLQCERLCGRIITALLADRTIMTGTLTYLLLIFGIGLGAVKGLVYIVNIEQYQRRSTI